MEFISEHKSDQIQVWIALYVDNVYRSDLNMPKFVNVNGPIEYSFNYNPVEGYYDLYLYNPATGEAREEIYYDSTPSTYINSMGASTELKYPIPLPTWYDQSTIAQYVGISGTTYYYPTDLFSMGTVNSRSQYVDVSGAQDGGHYLTMHKDGSGVS